jgi:hypothetical protein
MLMNLTLDIQSDWYAPEAGSFANKKARADESIAMRIAACSCS